MANTTIQIKRSTSTATPVNGSLAAAEPAYSYNSGKLFIGSSDGSGVVEIGGKYFIDTLNAAYAQANAAYNWANVSVQSDVANGAFYHANSAYDKANSANLLAYNVSISANLYSESIGLAGNNYMLSVATAGNNYTKSVGAASNTYADAVGLAGNNYTNAVGLAGNNYTNFVGDSANTYAAATYFAKTGGTVSGDVVITGNLTTSGTVTYANTQHLFIGDNILTLNADLPAGVAPSENAGIEVNRGSSPNSSFLWSESLDTWTFSEGGAFYEVASNLDIESANSYTVSVGLAGNNYMLSVAVAGNNYTNQVGAASNTYADGVGLAGNNYMLSVATAGNNYTVSVGAAGNNYTNQVGAASNTYAENIGAAANTNAANASYLSTGTVPTARVSGSYTGITGVGTLVAGVWNAQTIDVPYGGTGVTSFTSNGILYGNNSGALKVTAAGTDGQVLQSDQGVPKFAMLDGGVF